MTLQTLGSRNRMSRRDFLKIIRLKKHGMPIIDREKCTGCGLCTIDCPTKALVISQLTEKEEAFQILFLQETCNACGVCEKSCPENCLQWVEKEPEQDKTGNGVKVLFEDETTKCVGCGIPLFPQSMVKKLKTKIFMTKEPTWSFNLCPSCRMKTQFKKERVERVKT
jgi:NAD-dependent dihydropyrimidine dehydrogenase PreA subunit